VYTCLTGRRNGDIHKYGFDRRTSLRTQAQTPIEEKHTKEVVGQGSGAGIGAGTGGKQENHGDMFPLADIHPTDREPKLLLSTYEQRQVCNSKDDVSGFKVHDRVLVHNLLDVQWYEARITKVDASAGECKVHFHGWSDTRDEWIQVGPRLVPLSSANASILFEKGDPVVARFQDGRWYDASIFKKQANGLLQLTWLDQDPADRIKRSHDIHHRPTAIHIRHRPTAVQTLELSQSPELVCVGSKANGESSHPQEEAVLGEEMQVDDEETREICLFAFASMAERTAFLKTFVPPGFEEGPRKEVIGEGSGKAFSSPSWGLSPDQKSQNDVIGSVKVQVDENVEENNEVEIVAFGSMEERAAFVCYPPPSLHTNGQPQRERHDTETMASAYEKGEEETGQEAPIFQKRAATQETKLEDKGQGSTNAAVQEKGEEEKGQVSPRADTQEKIAVCRSTLQSPRAETQEKEQKVKGEESSIAPRRAATSHSLFSNLSSAVAWAESAATSAAALAEERYKMAATDFLSVSQQLQSATHLVKSMGGRSARELYKEKLKMKSTHMGKKENQTHTKGPKEKKTHKKHCVGPQSHSKEQANTLYEKLLRPEETEGTDTLSLFVDVAARANPQPGKKESLSIYSSRAATRSLRETRGSQSPPPLPTRDETSPFPKAKDPYTHTSPTREPNTARQHTEAHCNTLQRAATHCSTLQHTAPHCTQPKREQEMAGLDAGTNAVLHGGRQEVTTTGKKSDSEMRQGATREGDKKEGGRLEEKRREVERREKGRREGENMEGESRKAERRKGEEENGKRKEENAEINDVPNVPENKFLENTIANGPTINTGNMCSCVNMYKYKYIHIYIYIYILYI